MEDADLEFGLKKSIIKKIKSLFEPKINYERDYFGIRQVLLGMEEYDLADYIKYGDRKTKYIVFTTLVPEKTKELKQLIKKSRISRKEGKKKFEEFFQMLENARYSELSEQIN
jgi:hypothetical protein